MAQDPQPHRNESTESIELGRLVMQLWRGRRIIGIACAVSIGLGLVYLVVTPPVYRATTRLLVVRQGSARDQTPARYDPAFVATQAEIVRSRTVVENALDAYQPPNLVTADDPVSSALKAVRVTPVEGTNVMQVSYECSDQQAAERMLEAVLQKYKEYTQDTEQNSRLQSLSLLTESEQELRKQLDRKEAEYRDLLKQGVLLAVGDDVSRVHTEYLSNLGKALTEVKNRRLQMENESVAWIKSRDALSTPSNGLAVTIPASLPSGPFDDPRREQRSTFALPAGHQSGHALEIRAMERELQVARQREAELTSRFGDKYPDVRAIRAQIRQLESQLEAMLAEIPKILQSELDVARKHEQELEAIYERELQRGRELELHELQNRQYLDSIERLRAAHGTVNAELHTLQPAAATATGQGTVHIRTITAPRASRASIWPIPAVVLAICGALGFVGGSGVVLVRDRFASPDSSGSVNAVV